MNTEQPVVQLTHDFKIMVGRERGTHAMIGKITKGTGMSVVEDARPAQPINGFYMFPSLTEAWGRRVVKGVVPKGRTRVEITDSDYTGEIEWLKYGDKDGYAIKARYVRGQSSLDYDYQVVRLRLKESAQDEENAYQTLSSGETQIHVSKDQAWATFIQIHHMNEDSLCKSENAEGSAYRIVKEFNSTSEKAKNIDRAFDALKVVKAADSFAKLQILETIIAPKKVLVWSKGDENSLYDALLIYAKEQPDQFIEMVEGYKRNVSEDLSIAESFEMLEVAAGDLYVIKPKKELLLSGVGVKISEIGDYMFERCLDPEVYAALGTMKQYLEKLK